MTPLIELRSVSKYFGSVIALKDVSFDVRAGEVHCLLGDNGAGKSTLIKTLSGVHTPDSGEILVAGQPARFGSPKDTLDQRHRHRLPGPRAGAADERRAQLLPRPRAAEADRVRSPARPRLRQPHRLSRALGGWASSCAIAEQPVGTLSGGERQCLAIARAIHFGAKVLILDEPTSALGVHQASVVLKLIVQSKARGIGVIFISHNVHHAYVVGDRFTILKRGKSVGTYGKDDISRDQLLNLMAGGKELVDLEAEIGRLPKSKREH